MAKHKKDISKKAFQQLEKKSKKENKLIVQKKHHKQMRLATIVDLPLKDKGYFLVGELEEEGLRVEISKGRLKTVKVEEEELKHLDKRYKETIANWFVNKAILSRNNWVKGNLKDLVRFCLPASQRPRKKDLKKTEVNLKCLGATNFATHIDGVSSLFQVLDQLTYDDKTGNFIGRVSEAWLIIDKGEFDITKERYVRLSHKDLQTKQQRHQYKLRKYWAEIKHSKEGLWKIKGETILKASGYLDDIRVKNIKKYKADKAKDIINRLKLIVEKDDFSLVCLSEGERNIRKKRYRIKPSKKLKRDQFIPKVKQNALVDEVTIFINQDPKYPDENICTNKAKSLLREYGYTALKKAIDKAYKEQESPLLIVLEDILESSFV